MILFPEKRLLNNFETKRAIPKIELSDLREQKISRTVQDDIVIKIIDRERVSCKSGRCIERGLYSSRPAKAPSGCLG